MKTENSQLLYDRAQRVITAGVNSNSRARSPHPLYFARADGPFVWDVDGNRYIDLGMGNGAILLGHNNPLVRAAVERALANGITTGLETESAIRAAELFIRIVPYAERVRFTNTGTEALMHAVQIARAKTGRRRIAKIEGAYHGWTDAVFVSTWPNLALAGPDNAPIPLPGTGGLDSAMIQDTIVIPFNDIAAAETILRANANDLAAILVEPTMIDVGFIPAERAFLVQLRQLASEIGAVLIFDELLTGFRLARGGAQEFYDVQADLAMFGKALGNGFPVAAVAGKAEFLEKSAPGSGNTTFVGTFNGHAVVMAAVEASLAQLADGRATRDLHARTSALIEEFGTFARRHGVAAQMYGGGGHIHWYFTDRPVRNYRDAARSNAKRYSAFITTLAEAGFLVSPNYLLHHAISLAHSQSELEQLVQAMERGLEAAAKIPD
jgi:glutamate-1-semialdehyde 2,1-aminomutase